MNKPTEYTRLRENILRIGDHLRMAFHELLTHYDLTPQQFNALKILEEQKYHPVEGSFSTQDLRDKLLDKMSDTPRLVNRLIKKKLIDKKPCDHDGRRVHLWITDTGHQLLEEIQHKVDQNISIWHKLDLNEVQAINMCLSKVT